MAADGTNHTSSFNATTSGDQNLQDAYKKASLPDGWRPCGRKLDDIDVQCFYAPVDKPQAISTTLTGMGSSPLALSEELNKVRQEDVSVKGMALYHGNVARYAETNRRILPEFLFNPDSPMHAEGDRTLPHVLITHSASAFFVMDLLTRDGNAERARKIFDGVIYINPFFDTYGSSAMYAPLRSMLYQAFARCRKDSPIMTSPLEKWWTGRDGAGKFHYDVPTHGLILEMLEKIRESGREIMEDRRPDTRQEAFRSLPQLCIVGKNDRDVCNLTTMAIARKLGIAVEMHPIDHSGAFDEPTTFTRLIAAIKSPATQLKTPSHVLPEPSPRHQDFNIDHYAALQLL